MKKQLLEIVQKQRDFLQEDFNLGVYLSCFIFLALSISLNYQFDFEDSYVDIWGNSNLGWLVYFLYFGLPYFYVIIANKVFRPNQIEITKSFWLHALFAIALLSFKSWFNFHQNLLTLISTSNTYFLRKVLNNIVNVSILSFGLLFFYFTWEKYNKNGYGVEIKKFSPQPYVILLALMVPLLIWASFQPDFLASYPRLHPRYIPNNYGVAFTIFEPTYLLTFFSVEWFFRGFLVIGMVQTLGKKAILPMAILYCVFHFGKPLGECIGSFFGGYILGVIAYQTRNIWGGVLIHVGIAFLMDIFALLSIKIQHLYEFSFL